ncbi:MAG: aminotransferase class I/II-fold pyridoxal phosphate-dependent enzyme [Cyanobacteriota bacterium]
MRQLEAELAALPDERRRLLRTYLPVGNGEMRPQGSPSPEALLESPPAPLQFPLPAPLGGPLLDLASNDYLGFSRHPAVIAAAAAELAASGLGAGASRLVCGSRPIHGQLEQQLAQWLGRDQVLLFPRGFQANLAALVALADRHTLVLADRHCHHSLLLGVRASGARLQRYAANDLADLERRLLRAHQDPAGPPRRLLVVSESLFSMDGTSPDVAALAALCRRFDALLLLDEAHALGVLGPGGRGLARDLAGVTLISGTLGKAFGSGGAFLAADGVLAEWLLQHCGAFRYTTALAPALAAGARAALELLIDQPQLPAELLALAGRWRAGLAASGWSRPPGYGPILPLLVGGDRAALELQQRLQSAGLLGVAIRPPTVPAGSSRLRLVVRLGLPPHTLDQLLAALGPGPLPASPAPPVTRVVVGASGSSPGPEPPVQLIAMHGWGGDGGPGQAGQPAATSRGWGLQLGERGYGRRPALLPPWPRHGRKGLICHSLGVHLVPPEVLAASEAVVLLASFGRFVPPGAEGRPLRIALAGMAAELQESGDELTSSLRAQQLLQRFLSKVLGPGALAAGFTVPPGPADQPIGPAGRDRLRCDLALLGRLTALPASFPRQVPVLLLEATDDPIVHPAARERLRQELPQARVKLLAGSGHAMADPALIPLVLDWLQDGLT